MHGVGTRKRQKVGAVYFGCPSPGATAMNNRRSIDDWQRPLDFLAEAPLGLLIARGQVRRFAPDAPVIAGDHPAEWAFLVLSGSCQLQRRLPGEAGMEILRTYKRGETFGGLLLPGTQMIATED